MNITDPMSVGDGCIYKKFNLYHSSNTIISSDETCTVAGNQGIAVELLVEQSNAVSTSEHIKAIKFYFSFILEKNPLHFSQLRYKFICFLSKYARLRAIKLLKLTEIEILWVYYTIPFGLSLIGHFFWHHFSTFCITLFG